MKKIIISLVITIVIATALYKSTSYCHPENSDTSRQQYKIAILTPTAHPALEEVEQGFKETINKTGHHYTFTTFNANGNRTLMRAQAEEMVHADYDLLLTIGASASQTVAELERKKRITIPQVFCSVDQEAFARQLVATNPSTTGVYVKTDYTRTIDVLKQLKPATRRILLVYDPTHGTGLEEEKQLIERHVQNLGMQLHSIAVYQPSEIAQKVPSLLAGIDAVLVLIDNTVVSGIDALITLCNRTGVTLVVSDLASGKKGAALAYGITEYESGAQAAAQAIALLHEGKKADKLPITPVQNCRVSVNKDSMKKQNLAERPTHD